MGVSGAAARAGGVTMRWGLASGPYLTIHLGAETPYIAPLLRPGAGVFSPTPRTCRELPRGHSNDVSVLFGSSGLLAGVVRDSPMFAAMIVAMRSPHIA